MIGCSIRDLGLPRDLSARFSRATRRTFRSSAEQSFDFSVDVAGLKKHFTVRIVPELDDDGDVGSALAITYDVTHRTEVELQRDALYEQEQAARAKAEAAARARDQFLAIVSHELRSPLNGIQSWSHVLENQLVGAEAANPLAMRALEGIRSGIQQEVALIEHLLDATLALTGEIRLERESFVARDPIEKAVASIRSSAIAKDIAVYVDMRLVDETLHGDTSRVRQVFDELLSNAVKFTPRGGSVWLSARAVGGDLVVVVRDSGRGLAEGFERWLFEPFLQADGSNTRKVDGLGLGLSLSKRLAELHEGRIDAESAGPHLGTTFTVTMPLESRIARGVPAFDAASPVVGDDLATAGELAGIDALIVDDQLEAREALSALLIQFGAEVTLAASSRAGLEAIDRRGRLPDIVICDIAMPEEDGYGFLRRLRAYEATLEAAAGLPTARVPVVALSAFTEARRQGGTIRPDFDSYLAKPVSPRQLMAILTRHLARAT